MRAMYLISLVVLAGCLPPKGAENGTISNGSEAMVPDIEAAATGTATAAPQSAWSYSERKDEMRGQTGRTASVEASSQISLPFPYGDSTPTLVLRSDPKYGFDVYITANGQFLCRTYNDDTLSVKFDDGPVTKWICADAEGGSSDIVFVRNGKQFLTKLRQAKRVIIEADMYQAGRQQMTFNVAGLKWDEGAGKGKQSK